jgi:transglutaminase-like putative cysteine protease
MRKRMLVACVLLAAAVPGLLFAPVFGLVPLLAPVAVVLLACYAVAELCLRVRPLVPWRPVLALVVGALALAETELADTTRGGVPTGATVRALVSGVTESWQLTLQSTWPVRPDPALLLFVPLIVLFTAVLGMELLRRPAAAVLPSVAALLLSQAFTALTGVVAAVVAFAYAATLGGLLLASRPARTATALLLVPTLVLGMAATALATVADQGSQPALTLQHNEWAAARLPPTANPLDEVAARMENPTAPVFSYTSGAPVDRWRLAVLSDFDGVTWTGTDQYRRLGAQVGPQASVTVPTTTRMATVTIPVGTGGPWLPSQAMPASVTGAAPLIDPASGMLLLPGNEGARRYSLTWREPQVDPHTLADAPIDSTVPIGDLGVVPPGIAQLARTATGGVRPTFQAALVLERYLRDNYHTATGADLPTGSGWPQLSEFLLDTKQGTSEQFAAAYVVLARIVGIAARLAVGYRVTHDPGTNVVVHDGDVLAWPEVAVAGVGWVPLDPTGKASGADATPTALSQATAKARADLPAPTELRDPPLPPSDSGSAGDPLDPTPFPTWPVLIGLLALILLIGAGIPVAKAIRALRRRRRKGAGSVVAAWWEARDLLRAHGTPVSPGTTVRDLAGTVGENPIVEGLLALAGQVDAALWSGATVNEGTVAAAWAAVRDIRRNLAGRPLRVRVRAVFDPRSLLR